MSDLYVKESSFLKRIGLRVYCRVMVVCIDVISYCRFWGKRMRKYCFLLFLSNLLILTFVIRVIFGRWMVYGRRLVSLSLCGAKFRVLCYKQEVCCFRRIACWMVIKLRMDLGICVHFGLIYYNLCRLQDWVTLWRLITVPLKGWKNSNIWERR